MGQVKQKCSCVRNRAGAGPGGGHSSCWGLGKGTHPPSSSPFPVCVVDMPAWPSRAPEGIQEWRPCHGHLPLNTGWVMTPPASIQSPSCSFLVAFIPRERVGSARLACAGLGRGPPLRRHMVCAQKVPASPHLEPERGVEDCIALRDLPGGHRFLEPAASAPRPWPVRSRPHVALPATPPGWARGPR